MSASAHCRHIGAGNTELPMTPWEEETKVPCFTFPLTLPYMPFPGQFFICIFLKSCNPLDIHQEKIILCRDTCTLVFLLHQGFHGGSDDKESACRVGDLGSMLGLGRSPGGGNGSPL